MIIPIRYSKETSDLSNVEKFLKFCDFKTDWKNLGGTFSRKWKNLKVPRVLFLIWKNLEAPVSFFYRMWNHFKVPWVFVSLFLRKWKNLGSSWVFFKKWEKILEKPVVFLKKWKNPGDQSCLYFKNVRESWGSLVSFF